MHSSEQAGVLFIMELYVVITITAISKAAGVQS